MHSSRKFACLAKECIADTSSRIGNQLPIRPLARIMAYLRKTNPYVFEELVLYCFELAGHRIVRNRKYSGDGGIDGKVYLPDGLYYLQMKRYGSNISLSHVKSFCNLCEKRKVKGLFVHSGRTGKGVKEYLAGHTSVRILSGENLCRFLADSSVKW